MAPCFIQRAYKSRLPISVTYLHCPHATDHDRSNCHLHSDPNTNASILHEHHDPFQESLPPHYRHDSEQLLDNCTTRPRRRRCWRRPTHASQLAMARRFAIYHSLFSDIPSKLRTPYHVPSLAPTSPDTTDPSFNSFRNSRGNSHTHAHSPSRRDKHLRSADGVSKSSAAGLAVH